MQQPVITFAPSDAKPTKCDSEMDDLPRKDINDSSITSAVLLGSSIIERKAFLISPEADRYLA